ncbi:hypothetical protein LSTR_LSTR001761 [Laodelphax striatellus]|uniref:Uncharacterized protein n=1 Tax=Laodelphax striatellus TaxID=195883 RepID=A0A482WFN7_LAOST|nr:hypothetical protein LSTR_LSTR001761 [Laodelphax striatellus]
MEGKEDEEEEEEDEEEENEEEDEGTDSNELELRILRLLWRRIFMSKRPSRSQHVLHCASVLRRLRRSNCVSSGEFL